MERGVASRGARLVTARLGRPRDPARRALGPGCEELAVTDPDASPVREARPPGPKSPRWSAERRASLAEGRKAPHKRLACRVKARRPGASHERPYVSRCSAHPLFRVSEAKSKTRAQKRAAGTKRCCLKLRLSVGHSGRGAIAARAGIHNHWPWVWIPGSRASPAPRNDAQKRAAGTRRAVCNGETV